jgi:hypothetical protein
MKSKLIAAILIVAAFAIGRSASAFSLIEILDNPGGDVAAPVVLDNTVNKTLDGTGFSYTTSKTTTGQTDGIILIIAASSPEFDTAGLTRSIAIPKAVSIPVVTSAGTATLNVSADGSLTCGGGSGQREVCDNGVDDDGDGCVDSLDCDCATDQTKCCGGSGQVP